jgi:hypothetical protein
MLLARRSGRADGRVRAPFGRQTRHVEARSPLSSKANTHYAAPREEMASVAPRGGIQPWSRGKQTIRLKGPAGRTCVRISFPSRHHPKLPIHLVCLNSLPSFVALQEEEDMPDGLHSASSFASL